MCKPAPTATLPIVGHTDLLVRTDPLAGETLAGLGLSDTAVSVELESGSELYNMTVKHISSLPETKSFSLDVGKACRGKKGCCDSDDEDEECSAKDDGEETRIASKNLGLGRFTFTKKGATIHAIHHTLGEVVGTNCGPRLMMKLVLLAETFEPIKAFCDDLLAMADATSDFKFSVFKWHVQYQYWNRTEVVSARPLDSVVLPSSLKSKIVTDMEEFLSAETKGWYKNHGVPYKRSYLLHGTPGAGKTSLIQALAGKFKRNVCYLSSLSHPEMTDDNLKAAVQRVPARSLVVLEDVDALWEGGRLKKSGDKSALTFSGVLNALDGVGGSSGQIFILTTNHRERLDPALIRNGRVDVHLEFTDATKEQMVMLFKQFYKKADEALADKFADGLTELLGEERTVSCASLQHYFIQMRKASAEEAAEGVKKVIEEAEAHGLFKPKDGEKKDGKDKKKKAKGEEEEEKEGEEEESEEQEEEEEEKGGRRGKNRNKRGGRGGKEEKCGGGGGGKEVHVHVHVD